MIGRMKTVWASFLFAAAVTVSHAVEGDLILYFTMEEAPGGAVKDASGNGHDGLVVGKVKSVAGKIGNGFQVEAADEIQVEDHGQLDGMLGLTVEMWVYMETQQATGLIQKGANWPQISYLIQPWSDGNIYFGIKDTASRAITKGGDFPLSKWYHLAATYDGKMLRLFIDGVMKAEAPPVAGVKEVLDTPNPLQIGNRFAGILDDFVLYGRALSADEIKTDMSGQVLAAHPRGKLAVSWARLKTR